ncbi:MAG: VOC family protein [Myxococcales bacterium]
MAMPTVTVCPFLHYRDAPGAIRFLVRAFGLTENLVVPGPGGTVAHAQLGWRGGVIMLSSQLRADERVPLLTTGPGLLHLVTEDVDAHHAGAVAAGAEILDPPRDTDHGSRGYTARDPEGNVWRFDTYAPVPAPDAA